MFLAKKSGGIDLDIISEELLEKATEILKEAKTDPSHPIRLKFDRWILEFAQQLTAGDEKATQLIDNLKETAMHHIASENVIEKLLQNSKQTLASQLQNEESSLMQFFISNSKKLIDDLHQDAAAQQKMNNWMRTTISEMLVKFHSEIGNMVRESMMKLNNKELVAQIEDKVGNDLQYIRLNGAVVGGLVGIILALLKLL